MSQHHSWHHTAPGKYKCIKCRAVTSLPHVATSALCPGATLYDWSQAPEWANYAARDGSGLVCWFSHRPSYSADRYMWWCGDHAFDEPRFTKMNSAHVLEAVDPCDSLEARPERLEMPLAVIVAFPDSTKEYTYALGFNPSKELLPGDKVRVADGVAAGKWVTVVRTERRQLTNSLRSVDRVKYKRRPPTPNWDQAPDWANWWAYNHDAAWWFEGMPKRNRSGAFVIGHKTDRCARDGEGYPIETSGRLMPRPKPYTTQLQPKEPEPMTIKIENRTYVSAPGLARIDVGQLNEDQIFELISQAEREIKKLESLENKPKRLARRIEELKTGIKQLVELLDERDTRE